MTIPLGELLESWVVDLTSQRKSPRTIETYSDSVRAYLTWRELSGHCTENSPELTRATVAEFSRDLFAAGAAANTVRIRQQALRRFSRWLATEQERPDDTLAGLQLARVDEGVTLPMNDEEIVQLLQACSGTGDEFRDRRDEALVRVLLETGLRAGECVNLKLASVDIVRGQAIVESGKGGRGRVVPLGSTTCRSLDRYIRARRRHRLADNPDLWLGTRSRGFTYNALYGTLRYRAQLAGLTNFHPHLLRHTSAHRWLAAGGSEHGLMAIAGWQRPDMLARYTRARAGERAVEEARKLNLGDI